MYHIELRLLYVLAHHLNTICVELYLQGCFSQTDAHVISFLTSTHCSIPAIPPHMLLIKRHSCLLCVSMQEYASTAQQKTFQCFFKHLYVFLHGSNLPSAKKSNSLCHVILHVYKIKLMVFAAPNLFSFHQPLILYLLACESNQITLLVKMSAAHTHNQPFSTIVLFKTLNIKAPFPQSCCQTSSTASLLNSMGICRWYKPQILNRNHSP